jgi:hypothetical protein
LAKSPAEKDGKQMEPSIKSPDHTDFVEKDTSVKPVESDDLTPTEKFLTSYSIDSEIIDAFLYQERKHLSRLAGEMTELKELVVKKRATVQQEMLDLLMTEQQFEAKRRDYEFSITKSERRMAYLEKQRPALIPPPPPSLPPPLPPLTLDMEILEKGVFPSVHEQDVDGKQKVCLSKESTTTEKDIIFSEPISSSTTLSKEEQKVSFLVRNVVPLHLQRYAASPAALCRCTTHLTNVSFFLFSCML